MLFKGLGYVRKGTCAFGPHILIHFYIFRSSFMFFVLRHFITSLPTTRPVWPAPRMPKDDDDAIN